MLGALGTLLFFAVTAVFASRAAVLWGALRANVLRLSVALVVLGAWAHGFGIGLGGASFSWFLLSGLAGFGLGGVAMFQSLPRLGASLSMLIVQCGTVVVAAGLEWFWLGTQLSGAQLGFAMLTLVGIGLGLAPATWPNLGRKVLFSGVAWALCSALGQGLGAVLSRKAFAVARAAGEMPDPASTAYQRAIGGLFVGLLAMGLGLWFRRRRSKAQPVSTQPVRGVRDLWVVVANALTGPVLGVTCYQWALSSTPAGIVQPVVAASPLLTIPLSAWMEGGWPSARYYPGAVLAVAGVVGLTLSVA